VSRRSSPASRICAACSTTRTSARSIALESLARARDRLGSQAGKHVYVEKPSSHRVGRPQDGRGDGAPQQDRRGRHDEPQPAGGEEAIKFIHEGGLGKVYMARGLLQPRPAINRYPDGPMQPGENAR
jgi:hypothetical protein